MVDKGGLRNPLKDFFNRSAASISSSMSSHLTTDDSTLSVSDSNLAETISETGSEPSTLSKSIAGAKEGAEDDTVTSETPSNTDKNMQPVNNNSGSGSHGKAMNAIANHRFFLRKKDSQGSDTSNESTGSGKSSGYQTPLAENVDSRDSSEQSQLNIATTKSPHSHQQVQHHQQKPHHHHHHAHSLRRFIKKLSFLDHEDSEKRAKKNRHLHILPSQSTSNLYKKYGTPGRLLGSGASGSVNIVAAKTDPNQIFAVKKFRSKQQNETEADYKIKVKNEFKIGEYLEHQNLIRTYELIKETDSKMFGAVEYFMVMEYCPFDFFNLVMSGLMDVNEINCYFRQICSGVAYLHAMGLAHRDLKLDNCVVNTDGILKLIDFGSAVQFRKGELTDTTGIPTSDLVVEGEKVYKLIRSRGIVGSDPYLAPEVMEPSNFGYDSRLADVWSIAIMYCCMVLRRFPWKLPKTSDPSYKSYVHQVSDPDHNSRQNKLFKLLPEESVTIISKMLTIKPENRVQITQVVADEWFQTIEYCRIDEEGTLTKAENHQHNLVTEDQLQEINKERERIKKMKRTAVA